MALRLNDAFLRVRRSVQLVEAFRIALGKSEMPREWIEMLSETERERTLWLTSELLRSQPDAG